MIFLKLPVFLTVGVVISSADFRSTPDMKAVETEIDTNAWSNKVNRFREHLNDIRRMAYDNEDMDETKVGPPTRYVKELTIGQEEREIQEDMDAQEPMQGYDEGMLDVEASNDAQDPDDGYSKESDDGNDEDDNARVVNGDSNNGSAEEEDDTSDESDHDDDEDDNAGGVNGNSNDDSAEEEDNNEGYNEANDSITQTENDNATNNNEEVNDNASAEVTEEDEEEGENEDTDDPEQAKNNDADNQSDLNGNSTDETKDTDSANGSNGNANANIEDENLKPLVVKKNDCNCRYKFTWKNWLQWGGCMIDAKQPPPKGYMCKCRRPFLFTCAGNAEKCTSEDDAGCQGGVGKESCDPNGNCAGYTNKQSIAITK